MVGLVPYGRGLNMGRTKKFKEPSVSISVRVPASKVAKYRIAVRKFVQYLYDKEKKEE